jgi:hypothetical protein
MVELGPFATHTTTTSASDLVSFTCATLVSSNANNAQWKGGWAYLNASTGPNLAASRMVANEAGLDPDTGAMTVARAFATTVTSGIGVELSSRLPAITDEMGTLGVREIVNDTLLTIPPIDLLPVTGVTAQSKYDLTSAYPWLTERSQIIGIYYQDVSDEYPRPYRTSWDWVRDVDTPFLTLPAEPFITGQTFYIKARRPAQTWIKQLGATWTADTDGLQYDTDEALPLRSLVRAQSLATCYRLLGSRYGPAEYRDHFVEREAHWQGVAYNIRRWDTELAEEETTPRVRMRFLSTPYGSARSY